MEQGTILFNKSELNPSGGYIQGKIDWTAIYDPASGKVKLTTAIYCKKGNDILTLTVPTSGVWHYQIIVTDRYGFDHYYNAQSSTATSILTDWVKIGQTSWELNGNNDKTDIVFQCEIAGNILGPADSSYADLITAGNKAIVLYNKPRVSEILFADSVTVGGNCRIGWEPASAEFGYKIRFSVGNWQYTTGVILPQTSEIYTYDKYSIPYDILYAISETSTPRKATVTVTLFSYADTACTELCGTSGATFTLTIPQNEETMPLVAMTPGAYNAGIDSRFSALYIQGISTVRAEITAEGKYGALIRDVGLQIAGNQIISASPIVSPLLSTSGTVRVRGLATDMRGVQGYTDSQIQVLPYGKPCILPPFGESSIVCKRCDKDGNLAPTGTFVRVRARVRYSVLSGADGENLNLCAVQYAVSGGTSATVYAAENTTGSGLDTIDFIISDMTFEKGKTYVITLTAADSIGKEYSISLPIPTASTDLHLGGNKVAFGKRATREKAVDIADDWNYYWRDMPLGDMVCDVSDDGVMYIRKWAVGRRCEIIVYGYTFTPTETSSAGNLSFAALNAYLPIALTDGIVFGSANNQCYVADGTVSGQNISFTLVSPRTLDGTKAIKVYLRIFGTY